MSDEERSVGLSDLGWFPVVIIISLQLGQCANRERIDTLRDRVERLEAFHAPAAEGAAVEPAPVEHEEMKAISPEAFK